jgi:hypothetical protein
LIVVHDFTRAAETRCGGIIHGIAYAEPVLPRDGHLPARSLPAAPSDAIFRPSRGRELHGGSFLRHESPKA